MKQVRRTQEGQQLWEAEKAKEAQAKSAHLSSTLPNSYRLKKKRVKTIKNSNVKNQATFHFTCQWNNLRDFPRLL